MRSAAGAAVVAVAVAQAVPIGLFAFLALSGDSLGIARGMAVLLTVPFCALTIPALFLLGRGRIGPALGLAGVSLPASWILWRFA